MTNGELETTTNETFVLRALDKALRVEAPLAAAHVARLRRKSPRSSPQEILRRLNNEFRAGNVIRTAGSADVTITVNGKTVQSTRKDVDKGGSCTDDSDLFDLDQEEQDPPRPIRRIPTQ